MPNPKTGTVTFDIAKAVQDARRASSSTAPIACQRARAIGKQSFSEKAAGRELRGADRGDRASEAASAKGRYIKGITVRRRWPGAAHRPDANADMSRS